MARTMISEYGLPQYLWAEAVNTACNISNRIYLCKNTSKTSFEIYHLREPNVSYFRVFGCKCFVLNTQDNLGKFDAKAFEAIFVAILVLAKHKEYSINHLLQLKNLCMLNLRNLMHLLRIL